MTKVTTANKTLQTTPSYPTVREELQTDFGLCSDYSWFPNLALFELFQRFALVCRLSTPLSMCVLVLTKCQVYVMNHKVMIVFHTFKRERNASTNFAFVDAFIVPVWIL